MEFFLDFCSLNSIGIGMKLWRTVFDNTKVGGMNSKLLYQFFPLKSQGFRKALEALKGWLFKAS